VEAVLRKSGNTREEQIVFRKTVLDSHLRYKNRIILASDAVSEKGFLLEKKYFPMKGVFLVDNQYS
jgi:hypothetical protein